MEAVPTITSILSNSSKNVSDSGRSEQDNSGVTSTIEEIMENYVENYQAIQEYKSKRDECDVESNPTEAFLKTNVMPALTDGMCKMLQKILEEDSFYKQKSTFNGLDFLSEYLYNMNPLHPERKSNWTYIFDAQWVVNFLENSPRPFYPLSLIWSRDVAAKKIQSSWRGYCDRKKDEIQEVRQFWKTIDGKEADQLIVPHPTEEFHSELQE